MAPRQRSLQPKSSASTGGSTTKVSRPPAPFREAPESLRPFLSAGVLSEKHIYITHIDAHPAAFKRKMFGAPVMLNLIVVALFALRVWCVGPWYLQIALAGLGHRNETSFLSDGSLSWEDMGREIFRRGLSFFADFVLTVFVWPWPVEFVAARRHGNPVRWRRRVGFRDREIYVRRSRPDWDTLLGDVLKDKDGAKIFAAYVQAATSPLLQEQKTGYLLMNDRWNLDWDAMVAAHALADAKDMALDDFRNAVLVHHEEWGWLLYDLKANANAKEDEKRRQVFLFRDALQAMGKENLFYRWVELVQYEASQPGGFGPGRQDAAAGKIRDLFEAEGVDFDALWKETVGDVHPAAAPQDP